MIVNNLFFLITNYIFALYFCLYHLLYILENVNMLWKNKLLNIVSALFILSLYSTFFACYVQNIVSIETSAGMVTFFSILIIIWYLKIQPNQLKKGVEPIYSAASYVLLLFFYMSSLILIINLVNSLNYFLMFCGLTLSFVLAAGVFLLTLNSVLPPYFKSFLLLIIYCTIIFSFSLVLAPISGFRIGYDASTFELIYISLQNSYTLPTISNIMEINIVHIVQFALCKIFDVLILGTIINVLSESSKATVEKQTKRLADI